jgi:hypothetical protein
MEESKFKLPTEIVELPSKGLLYPEDSELAKGEIEMKYMTARGRRYFNKSILYQKRYSIRQINEIINCN